MHHDFGYCSAGGASRTCISSCMFGWCGVVSTCWISESWNCNSEIWRTWINTYENYVWWLPYYTINHGHIIIFSTMVYVYEMTISHGIWWLLVCLRSRIARCCCPPCTPPGSTSEEHTRKHTIVGRHVTRVPVRSQTKSCIRNSSNIDPLLE